MCDKEERVTLQPGETMDYMYIPYDEFFEFVMSDRFITSEQKRFMLHEELIKRSIKNSINKI